MTDWLNDWLIDLCREGFFLPYRESYTLIHTLMIFFLFQKLSKLCWLIDSLIDWLTKWLVVGKEELLPSPGVLYTNSYLFSNFKNYHNEIDWLMDWLIECLVDWVIGWWKGCWISLDVLHADSNINFFYIQKIIKIRLINRLIEWLIEWFVVVKNRFLSSPVVLNTILNIFISYLKNYRIMLIDWLIYWQIDWLNDWLTVIVCRE